MNWYYVDSGKQAGPVDDNQLDDLVRSGRIQADTLVWHEGMPNWQSYTEVRNPGQSASAVPPTAVADAPGGVNEAVCSECNRVFNKQDMIQYGTVHVCAGCKPIFMQKLAEGARVNTGTLNYAGFWIRFVAKFVDGLILGIVFVAPIMYFAFQGAANPGSAERFQMLQLLFQLVYIVASGAYGIFFIGKYGATPGKMACKLKVVTADGGRVSYARATGRFFAEMISGMICYIGYIMAGFDSQKRALHDHICNTRVIYK